GGPGAFQCRYQFRAAEIHPQHAAISSLAPFLGTRGGGHQLRGASADDRQDLWHLPPAAQSLAAQLRRDRREAAAGNRPAVPLSIHAQVALRRLGIAPGRDARVPVRFGAVESATAATALLIEGTADAPAGHALVRFNLIATGHVPGCACCLPRG